MTANVEIMAAEIGHVRELQSTLRVKDQAEARAMGLDPRKGLFYAYRNSLFRYTAKANGKVVAMWGVYGTPLANIGMPWLITGDNIYEASPLQFAREYKKQVQSIRHLFPVLENYVDANYPEAVRMLEIAGFTLTGPYKFGPNDSLFLKFRMET